MHPFLVDWPAIGLRVSSARIATLAAVAAVLWLLPRLARRDGLEAWRVRPACLVLGMAALVGARLHYLLATGLLWENGWRVLDVLGGGRHAPGAVLALLAVTPLVCRALSLPFLKFADVGAVALCVGIAIHRVGCFLHGCCFGSECDLPWCVRFPRGSSVFHLEQAAQRIGADAATSLPVHPLQLYLAATALLSAAIGAALLRRKAYDGRVLLVCLLLFSGGSAALETLRYDDPGRVYALGVPQLLLVTAAMTVLALAALAVAEVRHHARTGRIPSWVVRLRAELALGAPAAALVGALFGLQEGLATLADNASILPGRYAHAYLVLPILLWTVAGALLALPLAVVRATVPRAAHGGRAGYVAVAVFAGVLAAATLWLTDLHSVWAQVGAAASRVPDAALGALAAAVAASCATLAFLATRTSSWDRAPADALRGRWIALAVLLLALAVAATFVAEVKLSFAPARALADGDDTVGMRAARAATPGAANWKPRANVVLISIDTLRADHVGSIGGAAATPQLDRLASAGAVFSNAFSAAPWTLPAVASFLSGIVPSRHGAGTITNGRDPLARAPLSPSIWTVPQALARAGYRTQAIVTNPYLTRGFGTDAGFDGYLNLTVASEVLVAGRRTAFVRALEWAAPGLWVRDRGDDVSDAATRWLAAHGEAAPFFLWLHYVDPHPPYGAETRHKSFRGDSLLASTSDAADVSPAGALPLTTSPDVARLRSGEIRLSAAEKDVVRALYRSEVEAVDRAVGRVLDALDELRLTDETLVVVVSDHGEEFWEHGSVEHGHTLYDEVLHVPLLVRFPGVVAPGLRVTAPVGTVDVAPTIVALLGGTPPSDLDGLSLDGVLRGEPPPATRTLLAENLLFAEERIGLRRGTMKYLRWSDGREEAYDLAGDPRERRNLAVLPEVVAPLREAFAARRRRPLASAPAPIAGTPPALRARLRALGYGQ